MVLDPVSALSTGEKNKQLIAPLGLGARVKTRSHFGARRLPEGCDGSVKREGGIAFGDGSITAEAPADYDIPHE